MFNTKEEFEREYKFLEDGLYKALAGQKQTARIHVIVVHEDMWLCVYANISTQTPRPQVQATLRTIEDTLKTLWTKGICTPPNDGREKQSSGMEDLGKEYNYEFWLPGRGRTVGDFPSFFPETKAI